MNTEKYEQIKNDYCINVTNVNLSTFTNEAPQYINGESLTYNYNNGVVSFIDENGMSYVTPYYEIINTLEQAGYRQEGLYVPFENNKWLSEGGTYSMKWQNLVRTNKRNHNENVDLSDKFNIQENLENNMHM